MYHLIGMKSFSIYIARRKTTTRERPTRERPTMKSMRKAIFITMHIPLYINRSTFTWKIISIYIYMCMCRERDGKEKKQLTTTTTTENYKLQNNITYIQTCAPAIIHKYIAVYTYLIFYYIYYHEITKLLQQK